MGGGDEGRWSVVVTTLDKEVVMVVEWLGIGGYAKW